MTQLDQLNYEDESTHDKAEEAVALLEEAKRRSTLFDQFHLGTYVEALIRSGKTDLAYPLLIEALEENPDDPRLNYRMAELLRKNDQHEEAIAFSTKAVELGIPKAHLTLANVLHGKAQVLLQAGDHEGHVANIDKALKVISKFRPEYGGDQEVADAIAAKLHRSKNEWDKAKEKIEKYTNTKNPYTVYEQCKILQWEAETLEADFNYAHAVKIVQSALSNLTAFEANNSFPVALEELKSAFQYKEAYLLQIIHNQKDNDS